MSERLNTVVIEGDQNSYTEEIKRQLIDSISKQINAGNSFMFVTVGKEGGHSHGLIKHPLESFLMLEVFKEAILKGLETYKNNF